MNIISRLKKTGLVWSFLEPQVVKTSDQLISLSSQQIFDDYSRRINYEFYTYVQPIKQVNKS